VGRLAAAHRVGPAARRRPGGWDKGLSHRVAGRRKHRRLRGPIRDRSAARRSATAWFDRNL